MIWCHSNDHTWCEKIYQQIIGDIMKRSILTTLCLEFILQKGYSKYEVVF